MAINKTQRGFSLLIAVIFASVMLTFGLQLASLEYKQQVLASTALQSQYAFYAADAGLECALTADQQQNIFAYPATEPANAPAMKCDNALAVSIPGVSPTVSWTSGAFGRLLVTYRFSLDGNTRCTDVMVYKPNPATPGGRTSIYAQGYNVSCAVVANPGGKRFAYRGLKASY
jgi:hypothetical protein